MQSTTYNFDGRANSNITPNRCNGYQLGFIVVQYSKSSIRMKWGSIWYGSDLFI